MERHIYEQGDLAGSCFVFVVANAYRSLTGKPIGLDAWDKAIDSLPFPELFLKSIGTRERYGATLLDYSVSGLLSGFSGDDERLKAVRMTNEYSNFRKMLSLVTPSSVVIFAFKGVTDTQGPLNHWTCCVAWDECPRKVYTACSAAFVNRSRTDSYAERHHESMGRWSNDSFSDEIEHPFVFWDTVYQISLAPT